MRDHKEPAAYRKPLPFILSISLHVVIFCVFFVVRGITQKTPPPLIVDLTISSGGGSGEDVQRMPAAAGSRRVADKRKPAAEKSRASARAEPEMKSTPSPALVTAQARATVPTATGPGKSSAQVGQSSGASGAPKAEASGASGGTGGSSSADQGSAHGGRGSGPGSGMSGEQLRNGYLKKHFAYIKDIIQRNINYPPRARRMGWTGNVVVSFVINENGHASDERILKSSGFEVLDNNVIATIKSVSPFPRPPIKAELRVPINYQLE